MSGWYDGAAVKRANPIAEVLARYGVALRRDGRRLLGLCPLHGDRGKPNLHVYPCSDPARDSWFCFRCHVGGDAISFVMRHEKLDYATACAQLGGRQVARSALAPVVYAEPPRRWDRLTLREQLVMNTTAAVYQASLWRAPRALAYLRDRGVTEAAIESCHLGYADGRSLERHLRRESSLEVAEGLGLLRRPVGEDGGSGPLRELLAGRIVVPEIRGGHAVWMVGRWVGDPGERRPKYLGLPGEKPILGLERVVGRADAFLVEGVFGYLVGVAWDLPICSPCGTYAPVDRLGFLAGADTVWGLFDPDEAGRAASRRLGEELGARWRPLWLPDGRELDDLALRPDGREAFARCLAAARAAHHPRKELSHAV